jgi:transcriptional regulator with XRE-family HTH domain
VNTDDNKKEESKNKIFGKNVKYRREKLALTQKELADAAECVPEYISEIENCKANVTMDLAEKIALKLKVDLSDLIKELKKND